MTTKGRFWRIGALKEYSCKSMLGSVRDECIDNDRISVGDECIGLRKISIDVEMKFRGMFSCILRLWICHLFMRQLNQKFSFARFSTKIESNSLISITTWVYFTKFTELRTKRYKKKNERITLSKTKFKRMNS